MRIILIFIAIIGYLFLLVFIESELVKIEIRKENLENELIEMENQKKELEFELTKYNNLARIEVEAKKRGYLFPTRDDVLGVIKKDEK